MQAIDIVQPMDKPLADPQNYNLSGTLLLDSDQHGAVFFLPKYLRERTYI